MTLSGGVTASDILFHFTRTSGQVLNTSGGNVLSAPTWLRLAVSSSFEVLDLTGELIDGTETFSSCRMKIRIRAVHSDVDDIRARHLGIMLLGFAGLGYVGYRRRAAIAVA